MSVVFANVSEIISQWAFWTGLASVILFALSRFNVTLPDTDELSPPLRPRSFTTAFRFWLASSTYIIGYATLYLVLLIIGSIPELRDNLAKLFLTDPSSSADNPASGRRRGQH
jgi:hypothetical protein